MAEREAASLKFTQDTKSRGECIVSIQLAGCSWRMEASPAYRDILYLSAPQATRATGCRPRAEPLRHARQPDSGPRVRDGRGWGQAAAKASTKTAAPETRDRRGEMR